MKAYLHLIAVIAMVLFSTNALTGQICIPDTMALDSGAIISPRPYNEGDTTSGIKKPSCVGEYYELIFTMFVPDVFVYNGLSIPLGYAQLKAEGSVTGLPAGLSYQCNPEDCKMLALEYGCVVLSGTIADTVKPGQYDLTISLTLGTLIGPVEYQLPSDQFPGSYSIEVRETGQCEEVSSVKTFHQENSKITIRSNPLTPNSTISIFAEEYSRTELSIHDLMGRTLSIRTIQLSPGINEIPALDQPLAAGTYFISVGKGKSLVTKKVMVLP